MSGLITGDPVRIVEQLDANGVRVAESGGSPVIGEVQVLRRSRSTGKVLFSKTYHNDLLLTGAVYLCEKVNNQRSSFAPTSIDVALGVHSIDELITDNSTVPAEKICGIMVGNGGCGDTYNTVHPVHRTDLTVPGMIPFRVRPVDDDLDPATRAGYFLRTVRDDHVYYYGKKFTVDREIEVIYEDGRVVNSNTMAADSASTNHRLIRTFTKFTVTIDESDIREWFKLREGSTLRSLVNSVGLLTGYPGVTPLDDMNFEEFYNVRGMTTLNMENSELKDQDSTITFTYRLFFV